MSESNLKIIAYDSPAGGQRQHEIGEFVVDFNPASFVISNKIEYQKVEAKGQSGGDPQFDKIPPLEFSVEFTLDGTGIGNPNPQAKKKDYVKKQIRKLRDVTGCNINGDIHRPNYLAVLWGSFYLECVLTAMNITYNLFDREGTPIRAKISCSFLERIGSGKEGRQSRLESPDLTQYITVRAGDTLPLIARQKYNDPSYYLQLARINKLKNFRNLPVGSTLILPPMKSLNDE
ncbi:MAG: LysM peptidoglycan-binding domain-containing protein [Chitinophagaceae bacterium]|nr:MAG: LysM peptidoglycan-binding domain-containing protein [Chitinophagaceae bacterium]